MSARLVKTILDRAKKHEIEDDAVKVSIHAGQDVFNGYLVGYDPAGGFAELERDTGQTILLSLDKIIGISPRWAS